MAKTSPLVYGPFRDAIPTSYPKQAWPIRHASEEAGKVGAALEVFNSRRRVCVGEQRSETADGP
jgi:hypothetical protein